MKVVKKRGPIKRHKRRMGGIEVRSLTRWKRAFLVYGDDGLNAWIQRRRGNLKLHRKGRISFAFTEWMKSLSIFAVLEPPAWKYEILCMYVYIVYLFKFLQCTFLLSFCIFGNVKREKKRKKNVEKFK